MKKLIFVLLILFLATTVYALTDYNCLVKCLAKDYTAHYCYQLCESDPTSSDYRLSDVVCMHKCQKQGHTYSHCKDACSY